jgi:hypothetical protein
MKKCDILELLRDEPEELDLDRLIYAVWFRGRIERALLEADEDEGIPHDELVRESAAWRD